MPKKKKIHVTSIQDLNEHYTFSGKLLSDLCGVTTRSIERGSDPKDENYYGIKRIERGKYVAGVSLEAMFKHLRKQIEESKTSAENSAKNRKEMAQAKMEELKLAQLEEKLIYVDDVVEIMERFVEILSRQKTTFKKNLLPVVMISKNKTDLENAIEKEINTLFNGISTITKFTESSKLS